ncbi:MAG: hypothetical protein NC543_11580 [bacterium]|nr:hypothetical protein [bacterium]MCM1375907.1 hypothetical protein [Muribaculum sp.]
MVKNMLKRLIPIWLCLSMVCTGCGQDAASAYAEDVELLEPVGISYNYEIVSRRDMYDAKIYAGVVSPHVEEYELEQNIRFSGFDAYPGGLVRKGDKLLHANTEEIDKKIEDMEKRIKQMDEEYQEFLAEANESLIEPREERDRCKSILDNLEREKPEEFILVQVDESAEPEQQPNPEYATWQQQYKHFDGQHRRVGLQVDMLEEDIKQRTELYELDRAYNMSQLGHLKEERSRGILYAGMGGRVASINLGLLNNYWADAKTPLMSVVDEARVEIYSNYINRGTINKAEDVYVIVNGKRYEVEYQPIEPEEYKKLEEKNGSGNVFSNFTVLEGGEELQLGSYAVIVVLNQSRRDVLTVPKDAVNKDDSGNYVYKVVDNESVYTPVKTGMKDGLYVEILSGIEEGDKVLTEQKQVTGSKWGEVTLGSVGNKFSGDGYVQYLSEQEIKNPVQYGTCYFVESLVDISQVVKKGDVLARVRVVPDQAELDRNEHKLQRERERLAELRAMGEEKNKKAIAAKEETIKELEKLIAEMKADFAITEIKAPADGVITGEYDYETEALLPKDATLCWLADSNYRYVMVDDPNSQLSYGNRVEISFYDSNTGTSYSVPGTVVSLNHMAVSKKLYSFNWGYRMQDVNAVLILFDPEHSDELPDSVLTREGWRVSLSVDASYRNMENVLLVPRKAVTEVMGSTYVKVRAEDGSIQYVSFLAGGADSSNYWVIEGLTEGMEICLE